jgi:hypothetical protein
MLMIVMGVATSICPRPARYRPELAGHTTRAHTKV